MDEMNEERETLSFFDGVDKLDRKISGVELFQGRSILKLKLAVPQKRRCSYEKYSNSGGWL